jgi:aminocarboxymuconate-semialdehyde decarboxylase
MLKIDSHSHIIPQKMPNWANKFGYGDFISFVQKDEKTIDMMQGEKFFRTIKSNCWNVQERIDEYASLGVQTQVVCTIPVMFSYWANSKDTAELSRFLNDDLAKLQAEFPKNYIALATIPMQDADEAIKELERCKNDLQICGIQIGSNINDKNLNELEFQPIFEACEKLEIAIMIHPWNMMGKDKMSKYWLPWLVGMPAETSRAACSIIFGGILSRFPKLRIMFSHAGGSFLPTIGRIEHGFNCRPDLVAIDNDINPRNYLGKFWVDSITHDPFLLEYILKLQGSAKICLGSDYPFPLGDLTIGKFIEDMAIDIEDKKNIFYRSTLDWLQLSENKFV